MTSRQALHNLIDTLDEERVKALLDRIEAELLESPRMSPGDYASIRRGLDEMAAGQGVPHEEAMRRVGLDP